VRSGPWPKNSRPHRCPTALVGHAPTLWAQAPKCKCCQHGRTPDCDRKCWNAVNAREAKWSLVQTQHYSHTGTASLAFLVKSMSEGISTEAFWQYFVVRIQLCTINRPANTSSQHFPLYGLMYHFLSRCGAVEHSASYATGNAKDRPLCHTTN